MGKPLAEVTPAQDHDANRTPSFSVIIPTYNRGEKIYSTLNTVLAQSHGNFELIVVDDGSTDSTPDALAGYAQRANDSRLRIIRRENGGTTAARNTGIASATGDYIALLDHDDLWFPWTLQTYHMAIEQCGRPAVVAGRIVSQDLSLVNLASFQPEPFSVSHFENLLASAERNWLIYPSGWAIKADVLRSIGGFFPYNKGYEDLDLMLRIGTAPGYAKIAEPILGVRGLHEYNLSSDRHVEWFAGGMRILLQREHGDEYPGGSQFRKVRRDVICSAARSLAMGCARTRKIKTAWWVYKETFTWHLQGGRLRFLGGFPAAMTFSFLAGNNATPNP
jgi:glycosyltransferase involved in cell wall biosynthesis